MSGLELIGALVSVAGTVAGGIAENNSAKFEAQQMDMKAKEETAAAQRDALAKRQEGVIVNSRAQALAAAFVARHHTLACRVRTQRLETQDERER